MSQNTTAAQPRTVQTADRGKLDVRALVLLAILLAAGFILNFTVGKAISGISGGMISPEFIISAFCLTILVVRPNIGQALVIGLISAAVIQITTTSPFVDFAAEGIAAMLMAGIVNAAGKNGQVKPAIAIVATFLTTFVSGVIFMVIKMAMLGVVGELAYHAEHGHLDDHEDDAGDKGGQEGCNNGDGGLDLTVLAGGVDDAGHEHGGDALGGKIDERRSGGDLDHGS